MPTISQIRSLSSNLTLLDATHSTPSTPPPSYLHPLSLYPAHILPYPRLYPTLPTTPFTPPILSTPLPLPLPPLPPPLSPPPPILHNTLFTPTLSLSLSLSLSPVSIKECQSTAEGWGRDSQSHSGCYYLTPAILCTIDTSI